MKTHKQQLTEQLRTKITKRLNTKAGIHQVINEMALTPEGLEDVQKIGLDMWPHGRPTKAPPGPGASWYLARYHALLQSHPTKIFDGRGDHIGNIRHEDLNGQAMAGPSKKEVNSYDDSLHYYAYKANDAILDQVFKGPSERESRLISRLHQARPHPDHVRRGREIVNANQMPWGPAEARLQGLDAGPIT